MTSDETPRPATAAATTGSRRTRALRGLGRAWVAFPLIVLAAVLVMVGLDVNGSSVGILSVSPHADPALLAGTPRSIRSDEAALSTPNLVGNVRRGLPEQPWIGLTPTALAATSLGTPALHWTEAFKPQDWGLAVFGLSRGFAWHWWFEIAAGVLGLFALLAVLTRRPWVSAGLAVVGAFTPYTAWWSLIPGLVLGCVTGAAALVVLGFRARTPLRAVLLGLGAGYLATAGFLVVYPPWQIALSWVVLGVLVGVVLDLRVPLRRVLTVVVPSAVLFVSALAIWYVEFRPAIKATAGTIYPGSRLSTGGGGSLAWLLSAPANPWVAAAPSTALRGPSVTGAGAVISSNQSEIASAWLPLPLLVVVVVAVLVALRRRGRPSSDGPGSEVPGSDVPPLRWTTVGVTLAGLLLLAWTLLPLPGWFGRLTLLSRVPGVRTSQALGLAAIVLLAIGATVLGRRRWSWPWAALWVAVAVASAAASTWAGRALPWGDLPAPHRPALLAVSLFFAAGFALLVWRPAVRVAVGLLVVGAVASWVLVNPWYRGIGPLSTDPVVRAMEPLAKGAHPARVAVYGNETLASLVQSSGVEMLSDLTLYPDADVWAELAPDQQDLWNNYAKYQWVADRTADPAVIRVNRGTLKDLDIDPCAPETLALRIDWVVSAAPMTGFSCLTPYDTVKRGQQTVYRYRVSQG